MQVVGSRGSSMTSDSPGTNEGYDIVVNGENRLFADLELSAIASAGFHKEHYPDDEVQIRTRADGKLRTVSGHARLE
jgi:hypothetical protein